MINEHKKVYEMLKNIKSWDYIDKMNYHTENIEKFYQSIVLDVTNKKKSDYIEKKLRIEPSMVGFFYYFLYHFKRIPNQLEYIKFYYITNKDWIMKHIRTQEEHECFFGRLSRFYPSMLRDTHFYHLLKESGKFEKVLFMLKYDLEAKVDIFVKTDEWFGIQLRTLTKRSNEFYEKKKTRNPIEVKATLIDLPIDLNKAKSLHTKKDSIKLYSDNHIKQILNEIELHKTMGNEMGA